MSTIETPKAAVPAHLRNLRSRVLKELCRRARRLDAGPAPVCGDVRSLSQFLDALADTFSYADDLNLPGADAPLVLAESVYLTSEDCPDGRHYVLAVQRVDGRLTPVWAELSSEFRRL